MAPCFIQNTHDEMKRLMTAALLMTASFAMAEDFSFFESKVRPLLVERCIECHGAKKQKGDLRLDSKSGWQKGGESGAALVPGKPEESLLIKAVSYVDKDLQMPPKKQLAPEEVAVLKEWVKQGAADPRVADVAAAASTKPEADEWEVAFQKRLDWWSLKPLRQTQPPLVQDAARSQEPVDRFIRAALDAAKLKPAQAAEPEVLLRRLSFVLTGLPPTPEQRTLFLQEWQRDAGAAYETLVDALLASPHFGEHFARHWMDVVRYTDTYGYEWDIPAKGSWEYRDYLIRLFNADVGYDQMVREQLAGDLLPEPRINREQGLNESLIGPMFYHLGEHRHGDSMSFNGIHQDMVNNKIDAFSKAFLATTVACARCHNHKLEAVSQRDYYALAAVFMTPRWTAREVDAPGKNDVAIEKLKELRGAIRQELAGEWQARSGVLQAAPLRAWASENRFALESAKPGEVGHLLAQPLGRTVWMPQTGISATAIAEGTKLMLEKDGSILASGAAPEKDTYTVRFTTGAGSASLLRLEALAHDSLPARGPGRTSQGNFVLTQLRVEVKPFGSDGQAGPARALTFSAAEASYSQPGYGVENLLNPASRRGWAVGLSPQARDQTARFTFTDPVALPHGGEWTVTLDHPYGTQHVLGCFRLAVGGKSDTSVADADIASGWQERAAAWKARREQHQKANVAFTVLADFREPKLPPGWVAEGDGMRHGFVDEGTPLIALEGDAVIASLLPRGFHTHALSSKLPGSVFLPSQETWPAKTVSVQLGGDAFSAMQALVGNAFLGEDFGGGSPGYRFVTNTEPEWKTFSPVTLKNGVPQLLVKLTTAPLNSYFPARTGLVKGLLNPDFGYDKRSWLSLTGIVGGDQAGTPQDTLETFTTLYESATPKSADEAWQRMGDCFTAAIRRWCESKPLAGDVRLLNWMVSQKLLPNRAAKGSKLASLLAEYRLIEQGIAFPRTVMSMDERESAKVSYPLNVRGNVDAPGERVAPDFLQMFTGKNDVAKSRGSGRLELVESLLHPEHPLTSRVYVNRVWQWVFGTGLAATPDDFGRLGDKPSHPELLDWLAREFMREGWSTKSLVRRFVLSQTFRQSGATNEAALERDPGNRLLHHYPTRRLEAEAIRDSLLAVSGRLDPQLYGRPILPSRNAEDGKKRLFSGPLDGNGRRSLYLQMSIMAPPVFLTAFNLPDLKLPTGRRDVTNVPGQALTMLNDPFVTAMAKQWAAQLLQTAHATPEDRVRAIFVQAFGREPHNDEWSRWSAAVRDFATADGGEPMQDEAAWAQLAHTLFNTTEFLFYR
jgi:hypothetical protein